MKANETLAQVAARYGMSTETLRAVNGIGVHSRVPVGHAVLVPAERPSEATVASLAQAVFTTVPQGRTIYYQVRRGDTLSGVAKRYHVGTADLRAWNGLVQSRIRIGQRLRINSDAAPGASVEHRARERGTAKRAPVKKKTAVSQRHHAPAGERTAKSATKTKKAAVRHAAPAAKPAATAAHRKPATQTAASNGGSGG
jgi:LysM repeat protein